MSQRAGHVTQPEAARRSRTVLVTYLGAVVRHMDNWMPIAGTVDLMAQTGLDASSVRTAVSRLKQRGWLDPETRGGKRGYSLSSDALDALASGDEIVWHARQPALLADGWCVVSFSVPESSRGRRDALRTHLASLGFGSVGPGVWIAPARMRAKAEHAIAELDLTEQCAVFVGDYVAGPKIAALVSSAWDLDAIHRRYGDFIAQNRKVASRMSRSSALGGCEAFANYLAVIDQWRTLPFRDPGLPSALLPRGWKAPAAGALFEGLVSELEGPALAHAASFWPAGAQTS
jgi:phenylacetic acid degradation operon negative regulatory protein